MSRQARLVVIMAVMGFIGVTVLVAIARHYGSMEPLRSVDDAESRARAAGTTEPEGSSTAHSEDELEIRFRAFAAVRRSIADFLDEHPVAKESLEAELTGNTLGRDKVKMYNKVLLDLRVRRRDAISENGLDEIGYLAIRDRYRAWRSGQGEVEPSWNRTFGSHPGLVEQADLGILDPLDY